MADKSDTKDEITAVGPGVDDEAPQGVEVVAEDAGYQYPDNTEDDSDAADAADERVGHAEVESDDAGGLSREQKRRRRKREKYDRDQRELGFLRSRNEQLEREKSARLAAVENRQTQSDVLAIDGRISQMESDVREAENLLQQAMETKDSGAAVEALRVRDQLKDGLRQLQGTKHQTVRAAQERQTAATQPPQVDPAIASRAQEWAREHTWFDPNARDEDSAIAYAIEQRVFQEGRLSPATDAYWDEVDRRLSRRLPERYKDDDVDEDEPTEKRSPPRVNGTRKATGPTIKVGGRERTLKKGEVYIDEDRKAAMIENGVWDDLKERERFLKAYQKYDRDAGRRPR